MKKLIALILCLILLSGIGVFAEEPILIAGYTEPDIAVSINDEFVTFDVPPFIEDGRTLIPVRAVTEALGYDVMWNGDEQSVTVTDGTDVLVLYVGRTDYLKNGETLTLDVPPVIRESRTFVPVRLIAESFGCEVAWDEDAREVVITRTAYVQVSNVAELVDAIAPYTTIGLAPGTYNLSDLDETEITNPYVTASEAFDGNEYIISGISALTLCPESEGDAVSIVVEPRYACVLTFSGCADVALYDLTVGHTKEEGYCTGAVLNFVNTLGATVEGCDLYGCGTYGITADTSMLLLVADTTIHDCTYGCVEFYDTVLSAFTGCTFRNCREFSMFDFVDCADIIVAESLIAENVVDSERWPLISAPRSTGIVFRDCLFENNAYTVLTEDDVTFEDCELDSDVPGEADEGEEADEDALYPKKKKKK